MHDVAKTGATSMNPKSKGRIWRTIAWLSLVILGIAALVFLNVFLHVSILKVLIIGASAGAVLLLLTSVRRFKADRPTAGALLAVFALICVLADVKFLQFFKMTSTPMQMPATTVSSVVVKEEDWAPTLSAVGSISAVQGAVVATELAGVVSKIAFENGSAAKQGDMLVQLDTSAEEAQLRT